jgi:hypothetical protein
MLACLAGLSACVTGWAADELLVVPNGSFESPATPFVSLLIQSWQRTPKPDWYVEEGGFQWNQLAGIFLNTAPSAADHIEALDGEQAAWLFAVPEAGLFGGVQNSAGTAAAVFEAGRAYRVSIDVLGAGGNMLDGVELELSLFRWVDGTNRVVVGGLTITNSAGAFPSRNRLTTYERTLPAVKAGDPWVGESIGVQVVSRATQANQGGYWDIDRIRVEALAPHVPELGVERVDGEIRLKWASVSGWRYQVREAQELGTWSALGGARIGDGNELSVQLPVGDGGQRFYSLLAERVE